MTLKGLKQFIASTRNDEGVSWWLIDQTPLLGKGILFTLFVFANDIHVLDVNTIEERERRQIPKPIMKQIADARLLAGVDPAFKRAHPETWLRIYNECRRNWLDTGLSDFLNL